MREGGPFLIIIELFFRRAIDLLTRQAFQKRLICPEKEHPAIHGESGTIKFTSSVSTTSSQNDADWMLSHGFLIRCQQGSQLMHEGGYDDLGIGPEIHPHPFYRNEPVHPRSVYPSDSPAAG